MQNISTYFFIFDPFCDIILIWKKSQNLAMFKKCFKILIIVLLLILICLGTDFFIFRNKNKENYAVAPVSQTNGNFYPKKLIQQDFENTYDGKYLNTLNSAKAEITSQISPYQGSRVAKITFSQNPGGIYSGIFILPGQTLRAKAKIYVPAGQNFNSFPRLKIFSSQNGQSSNYAEAAVQKKFNQWISEEVEFTNSGDKAVSVLVSVWGMSTSAGKPAQYYFYTDMLEVEVVSETLPQAVSRTAKQINTFAYGYYFKRWADDPANISNLKGMVSWIDYFYNKKPEFNQYIHSLSPNTKIYYYHNSEAVYNVSPQYDYILKNHPEWLAKDASGNLVKEKNYPGNQIMNIANHSFTDYITDQIVKNTKNKGYDAIFLDVLCAYIYNGYYTAPPINPATGKVFTDTEWKNGFADFISTLRKKTDQKLIGNGIGFLNGGQYYSKYDKAKNLLSLLDGMMIEGFVKSQINSGQISYKNESEWKKDVDMLAEIDSLGLDVWAQVSYPEESATLSQADKDKLHLFSLASFLLGKGSHSYFGYIGGISNHETLLSDSSVNPFWNIPLGEPLNKYQVKDNIYMREYKQGIVLVNPTNNNLSINLGKPYKKINGAAVTQLNLNSHEGVILNKFSEK